MKGEPWHKRYHRRTLDKYRALDPALRGIAYTLLDLIYDNGGALYRTDQMIAGDLVISQRLWRSAKQQLIDRGYFYVNADGGLSNGTCEDVLEEWKQHARNGAVGGRARAEKSRKSANQTRTESEMSERSNENSGTDQARPDFGFKHREGEENSEAKASGASASFDLKKWVFTEIAGCFVSAGESESHGRSMAGKLWTQHPELAERIVTAMLADPPAKPSMWFGKVFKQISDKEKAKAAPAPEAPTREIVTDADGLVIGIRDLATGVVKPVGRAA